MSLAAWYHIASWTGSSRDCSAPLTLAFVSPSAREGVEMTTAGYSLPRKDKGGFPPFSIVTGLTRRNGLRSVNPFVYDRFTLMFSGHLVLQRRPLFARQLRFYHMPLPSCFDWWIVREQFKHPVILTLMGCRKDTSLPAAVYKELLVALHIWNDYNDEGGCFDARSLSGYPYIQDFVFEGSLSSSLRHAPCLSELPLQALFFFDYDNYDNHNTGDCNWISDIVSLRALAFFANSHGVDLSLCGRMPQLVSFAVSHCSNFRSLDAAPELARRLQHLRVSWPDSEDLFEPLRDMVSLVSLEVCGSGMTTLAVLEPCRNLERLLLDSCDRLPGLSGLSTAVPLLTSLHLKRTPWAEFDLKDVRECYFLEELKIERLSRLVSLSGLTGSPSLRRLVLMHCPNLTNTDGLSSCPKLESVAFYGCDSLESVSGLAGAPRLRIVSLSICRNLTSLDGLSQCPLLEEFVLRDCNGISSVEGLMDLPRLRRVNLKRTQITDASVLLRTCPSLKPSLMNLDSEELAKERYEGDVSSSDEDDMY